MQTSLDKDAMELLLATGRESAVKNVKIIELHDDGVEVEKIIVAHDGAMERAKFAKPARSFAHQFESLDGLTSFLNSDHCKEIKAGIVFVEPERVAAVLAYLQPIARTAVLALGFADEFAALCRLARPTAQKELWRALTTDLYGCMDPGLLPAISQIKISAKVEGEIKISAAGIESGSVGNAVSIEYADKDGVHRPEVALDWQWKGRIFEAFDQEYTMDLRLEVFQEGNGLEFVFHQRRPRVVIRQARADLVAELKRTLNGERYTVHEGKQ